MLADLYWYDKNGEVHFIKQDVSIAEANDWLEKYTEVNFNWEYEANGVIVIYNIKTA